MYVANAASEEDSTVSGEKYVIVDWQERMGLLGRSQAFLRAVHQLPIVSPSGATVMIEGESGTGKEIFARAVHILSGRTGPFVPVNCGAIPSELFERELFGHKRSAFTGAATSEIGLVQTAETGTLFLDEVDCLPLHTQSKLLRFLQEKEYRPLGSTLLRRADVRVIAASNANLSKTVRLGEFRQDLYYRLNVLPLVLPPLRQRREDIPLLAEYFLNRYSAQSKCGRKQFSAEALTLFQIYDWPGNVRELENCVERAAVLSRDSQTIEAGHVHIGDTLDEAARAPESFQEAKRRVIAQFERTYIKDLLASHHGNIASAARAARKNRRAFWELLRKHSISAAHFQTNNGEGREARGAGFPTIALGKARNGGSEMSH